MKKYSLTSANLRPKRSNGTESGQPKAAALVLLEVYDSKLAISHGCSYRTDRECISVVGIDRSFWADNCDSSGHGTNLLCAD
jgi:hypothetical protein